MNLSYMPDDQGKFATPQLDGSDLSFIEFPDQVFDLAVLQSNEPRRLLFSMDQGARISVDAAEDYWLIAVIDLPAKSYDSVPVLDGEGNPVLDSDSEPQTEQVVVPTTADTIKITLWQLKEL